MAGVKRGKGRKVQIKFTLDLPDKPASIEELEAAIRGQVEKAVREAIAQEASRQHRGEDPPESLSSIH